MRLAQHDVGIEQRARFDFNSRAVCDTCGWLGPWRNTLWTEHRVNRDANRHMRRAAKADAK
jgi:hypothetical protein